MKEETYKWTCPNCAIPIYLHFFKDGDDDDNINTKFTVSCDYCKLKFAIQYKNGDFIAYAKFKLMIALEETDDDRIY